MVLAHLRGLLKPGYEFGIRSRIRETVLLRAIDLELQHEQIRDDAFLQASLAGAPIKDPVEMIRSLSESLRRSHQMRSCTKDIEKPLKMTRDEAVAHYLDLAKKGLFGQQVADELGLGKVQ